MIQNIISADLSVDFDTIARETAVDVRLKMIYTGCKIVWKKKYPDSPSAFSKRK